MIPGADVSSFQGQPGSWRPKAGAIDWAAVKFCELSTRGAYRNPTAAADWAFLKASGKVRIAYAFGHPSVLPSATVELLADMLHPLGLDDGDGIALDLESTDGLSAPTVAAWARATTAAMRHVFGRPCILYSDLSFFEAGNCAGCGDSLAWIADISRPAGQPRVPSLFRTWAFHQFSWTPLDRDVANYATPAAMRAAIGKPAPAKPPEGRTVAFTADGTKSLQAIAAARKTSPAYILHLTAKAGAGWPGPVHDFLDDVFSGKTAASAPVPKGCVFQVPAP